MQINPSLQADFERVREMVGPALAKLHEQWRVEALTRAELLFDEPEKAAHWLLTANIHRELAAEFRDDEKATREQVLATDRAMSHQEGA